VELLETIPEIPSHSTTEASKEQIDLSVEFPCDRNVTCDESLIETALEYEQIYFNNVDAIHSRIQTNWSNFSGSRGSPTANEMYFWKNPYESMARMLMLAETQGLTTHAEKYQTHLIDALTSIMPRMFDGLDADNTGNNSKYRNNRGRSIPETRYNYLSISRALAWVGHAIWAIRNFGNPTTADEAFFEASLPRLKIMADFLDSELVPLCVWSSGGFGHMPSHLVAGMLFLEENAGYSYPQASDCLDILVTEITNRNGDVGSDLSHDMDTLSNLMIIRDMQLGGSSVLPKVTSDLIATIGDFEAAKISSGGNCVGGLCPSLPDHIGPHALAAGGSAAIRKLLPPSTAAGFPHIPGGGSGIAFSIQVSTLANAAWGYAQMNDNSDE
jgi:hypothetical protein